ncbi:MAG: hypothetical protein ACO1OB_24210 [Archangium sp.]
MKRAALLVFACCVPLVEAETRARLARLPSCEAGVVTGALTIEWNTTPQTCLSETSCCDVAGIGRAFITTSSGQVDVERERVQEVLGIGSVVTVCESEDIDAALVGSSVSFGGRPCVAR